MSRELEARIERLESTLKGQSDILDIYAIVASYVPSCDSCADDYLADTFADEGMLDTGLAQFQGKEAIKGLVNWSVHPPQVREMLAGGAGHVMSMPHIVIDGDSAVATFTSQFYMVKDGEYSMMRLSAIRMEVVRADKSWKIVRRISRAVNETGDGQELYRQAIAES